MLEGKIMPYLVITPHGLQLRSIGKPATVEAPTSSSCYDALMKEMLQGRVKKINDAVAKGRRSITAHQDLEQKPDEGSSLPDEAE
jgi:hypothetical protein